MPQKKVNVFLTVDTEHSIGGAFRSPDNKPVGNRKRIYGELNNQYYGIPLIIDIAGRYGLTLTFFLEVFNKYFFGKQESEEVCHYLLERRQDVQLHIHPNYLNFTLENPADLQFSDLLGEYSSARQGEIIAESAACLRSYGVGNLQAFRAGCYGADLRTLRVLKQSGFLVDSSYNRVYLDGPCLLPDKPVNDLFSWEGIYEFPLTVFQERTGLRSPRLKPLDINGVSFAEMKDVLQSSLDHGPGNITIILHSFSFMKPYDVQYVRARPRKNVIRRFEKLCRFLAENDDRFDVLTFGSLEEQTLQGFCEHAVHTVPVMPAVKSWRRLGEQLVDHYL